MQFALYVDGSGGFGWEEVGCGRDFEMGSGNSRHRALNARLLGKLGLFRYGLKRCLVGRLTNFDIPNV